MKKLLITIFIFTISFSLFSGKNKKEEIIIAVASSLKNVFEDIVADYTKQEHDVEIKITLGASGVLKSQIINGAPIDIFAFASMDDGMELVDKKFVGKNNLHLLCKNSMVLITRNDLYENKFKDFTALESSKFKKIAIGNPRSVPAGKYAKLLLEDMNIYEKIRDKFIFTDSVRQALTYLEIGEADASLVFKTDALISNKIKIIAEKSVIKDISIEYSIGITNSGVNKINSKNIILFILNNNGRKILLKYGFIL